MLPETEKPPAAEPAVIPLPAKQAAVCRHCQIRKAPGRKRGLCYRCYQTPAIRALYPAIDAQDAWKSRGDYVPNRALKCKGGVYAIVRKVELRGETVPCCLRECKTEEEAFTAARELATVSPVTIERWFEGFGGMNEEVIAVVKPARVSGAA